MNSRVSAYLFLMPSVLFGHKIISSDTDNEYPSRNSRMESYGGYFAGILSIVATNLGHRPNFLLVDTVS
jgi:hypothetical protein